MSHFFPSSNHCTVSSNNIPPFPDVIEAEAASRNFDRRKTILEARSTIDTIDAASDLYYHIIHKFGTTDNDAPLEMMMLFDGIRTPLRDGIKLYEKSPNRVTKWCVQTTPILTTYKDAGYTHPENLLTALKDGKVVMDNAQKTVWESKSNFNTVMGTLQILERYLELQFNENVENDAIKTLVSELYKKVALIREFLDNFAYTQNKLVYVIDDIQKIKEATDIVGTFVSMHHEFNEFQDLRDKVESVDNMIDTCNNFRKEYA